MSKKLKQIALLTFVVLIWGKVAVDFFSYSEGGPDYIIKPKSVTETPTVLQEKFSYELNLDYRDPFIGKSMQRKKRTSNQSTPRPKPVVSSIPKTPVVKAPKVKWPLVVSLGGVSNTNGNSSSVILKVNGQESIISLGDSISGVSLVELTRDSVTLSYMNEYKTLLK